MTAQRPDNKRSNLRLSRYFLIVMAVAMVAIVVSIAAVFSKSNNPIPGDLLSIKESLPLENFTVDRAEYGCDEQLGFCLHTVNVRLQEGKSLKYSDLEDVLREDGWGIRKTESGQSYYIVDAINLIDGKPVCIEYAESYEEEVFGMGFVVTINGSDFYDCRLAIQQ